MGIFFFIKQSLNFGPQINLALSLKRREGKNVELSGCQVVVVFWWSDFSFQIRSILTFTRPFPLKLFGSHFAKKLDE